MRIMKCNFYSHPGISSTACIVAVTLACAQPSLSRADWTFSSQSGPTAVASPDNTVQTGPLPNGGYYLRQTSYNLSQISVSHGSDYLNMVMNPPASMNAQCISEMGCVYEATAGAANQTNASLAMIGGATWSWPGGSGSSTVSNHVELNGHVGILMQADANSLAWGFAWAGSGTNAFAPYEYTRAIANGTNTTTGLDGFAPGTVVGAWDFGTHINAYTTNSSDCGGPPISIYQLQDEGDFKLSLDNATYRPSTGLTSITIGLNAILMTTNNVSGTGSAYANSAADITKANFTYYMQYP